MPLPAILASASMGQGASLGLDSSSSATAKTTSTFTLGGLTTGGVNIGSKTDYVQLAVIGGVGLLIAFALLKQ